MLASSSALAVMRCLSVCVSVTFVNSVETNNRIVKIFSPSVSHTILVIARQYADARYWYSKSVRPSVRPSVRLSVTHTHTHTHTDRQTYRHTDRSRHTQTDGQIHRETHRQTHTYRQTHTQRQTHRLTDRHTDRHANRTVLLRMVTILTARYFIITCRPVRSAAMPVLFLLSGPKNGVFALQGRQVAPTNVKFGTRLPPPCQITHLSWQKCGNTASKTVKIANFGHKFAP